MRAVGIVPARMDSSRYPGKPMAEMLGMPMVGHCYHRTRLADGIERAYVATCDEVIADYVRSIGGRAVMTSQHHTRATTRTAEALAIIEHEIGAQVDIVAMVQGDEPLIPPEAIAETLTHFLDETIDVVNVMTELKTLEAFKDVNNVKVVTDRANNALYFSREPIPSPWKGWEHLPRYMQTGIISFRREMLLNFNSLLETPLEQIESVDMNRVLETGGRVRMVFTEARTIGVDTPDELREAEQLLKTDPTLRLYTEA